MTPVVRRIGTGLAILALTLVLAHEAQAFAPHHDESDHHCCLCDAAMGITPVAAPLVRPEPVMAMPVPCDRMMVAAILLHADASRAPPTA